MNVTRNRRNGITDERGTITMILDTGTAVHSVLHITSKAGTIRSNHYHTTDAHYCYVEFGKVEWFEQPVAGGPVESTILHAGDLVFTPPMTAHAAKFLEDTVLWAFATNARNQTDYETDTVRVKLI